MPLSLFNSLSFLALPILVLGILAQVELWQRKEYRLDRYRLALFEPEPRRRLYLYLTAAFLTLFQQPLPAIILLAAGHLWRLFTRGLFRPKPTPKAKLILTISLLLVFLLLWPLRSSQPAASWAIILMFSPWLTALTVGAVNFASHWRKQQIIIRARNLRRESKDLQVIGITGSFGKTSTKHFLQQLLLDAKATREHRNSLYPVAIDMLEQLNSNSRTYIAEMGAYKQGEIADLARLTRPIIGVITAIGNQHLALFGSQENILKAKWELIDSLPAGGIAVLNADDESLRRKATAVASRRLIKYSTQHPADVYADNIMFMHDRITCRLHIFSAAQHITIPLAGEGALASVLAAVAAAVAIKTPVAEIFERIETLKPVPRTMELKSGLEGATIIDDSYSSNEQAVLASLKHLRRFPQNDKRVIFVPLIELGSKAPLVHRRLAVALKQANAQVTVYGSAFHKELNLPYAVSPSQLLDKISTGLSTDSVILLAGRLPAVVTRALLK